MSRPLSGSCPHFPRILSAYRALALGAALLVCLAVCRAALAQTPSPIDDEAHNLAKQMNCPTCAGRNLADCPTETCAQWKREIRDQLESGRTSAEVLDYFKSRFGPSVMQEPPKEGGALVLWILPVLGVAGLALAGAWAARRAAAPGPVPPGSDAAAQDSPADPFAAELEHQVDERPGPDRTPGS